MKVSRFLQKVKIKENVYAIYNNLIMKIIFINDKKYREILKFDITDDEIKLLQDYKIYVNDNEDEELLRQKNIEKNSMIGKIKTMYLCVTNCCNLGCSYCFINNQKKNNSNMDNMNEEIALLSLEKYAEYLRINNFSGKVVFYGGEPLIKWNLIKKCVEISRERKYPISFSIITNGTLLEEKMINFFKENNVNIGISIDGPKEINDKNRKYVSSNKSVYDDIFRKIKLLKKYKCDFGLSITLSNEILDKQDIILNWLEKVKVKSIAYNLLHYTWEYSNWKEYYEETTKFICESYLKLDSIVEATIQGKINSVLNEQFKFFCCSAIGKRQIVVKPNGDLCICHGQFRDKSSTISNIKNIRFENINDIEKLDDWCKIIPLNNNKCLKCESLYSCGGGCLLQSKTLFKDKDLRDKAMCIFNKKILRFILVRIYEIMKGGEEDAKS